MTLLPWMLYAMLVPLLLGAGVWLLERALLAAGRPVRWVWSLALVGSVGIPFVVLADLGGFGGDPSPSALIATSPSEGVGTSIAPSFQHRAASIVRPLDGAAATLSDGLQRVLESGSRMAPRMPSDRLVAALWGGGALLLFLIAAAACLRLRARARRWPSARLDGIPVRIAPRLGPAVVGVIRPVIVLPRWAMSLQPAHRNSILVHEREHILSRDTLLLTGAAALVVTCFWSPGLWWLLGRLRGAVEVDCDRRVLAGGVCRREYASLLVQVGMRKRGLPLPMAALAEPSNLLERRLKQMKINKVRHPFLPVAAAAVATGVLLAVACGTDAPTAASDEGVEEIESLRAVGEIPPVDVREVDLGEVDLQTLGEIPTSDRWGIGEIPTVDRWSVGELGAPGESLTVDGSMTRLEFDGREDAPLLIVDGVILRAGRLTLDLDPASIETIEVVRGSAARELYGSRAANGVLIITTRSDGR